WSLVLLEEFGADGAADGHPQAACLGGGEVAAAGLVFELGVGEPEPGEGLAGGVVELGFGQLGHHVVRVVSRGHIATTGLVAELGGVPVGEAALPCGVQGGPAGFGFLGSAGRGSDLLRHDVVDVHVRPPWCSGRRTGSTWALRRSIAGVMRPSPIAESWASLARRMRPYTSRSGMLVTALR